MRITTQKTSERVIKSIKSLKFKLMNDNGWTESDYNKAEGEYIRFLTLKMLYPGKSLAPSELIDVVWHAHILNTSAYHEDCNELFGFYLHHIPHLENEKSDTNETLFDETKKLFPIVFSREMIVSKSARCEGQPCHAPTPCRCR